MHRSLVCAVRLLPLRTHQLCLLLALSLSPSAAALSSAAPVAMAEARLNVFPSRMSVHITHNGAGGVTSAMRTCNSAAGTQQERGMPVVAARCKLEGW